MKQNTFNYLNISGKTQEFRHQNVFYFLLHLMLELAKLIIHSCNSLRFSLPRII